MVSESERIFHDFCLRFRQKANEKMSSRKGKAINRSVSKGIPRVTKAKKEQQDRLEAALALASIGASPTTPTEHFPHPNSTFGNSTVGNEITHQQVIDRSESASLVQVDASGDVSLDPRLMSSDPQDVSIPASVFALVNAPAPQQSPSTSGFAQVRKNAEAELKGSKQQMKYRTPRPRKKTRYGLPDTITVPKGMLPGHVQGQVPGQVPVTISVTVPTSVPVSNTSSPVTPVTIIPDGTASTASSNAAHDKILQRMMQGAPSFAAHMKHLGSQHGPISTVANSTAVNSSYQYVSYPGGVPQRTLGTIVIAPVSSVESEQTSVSGSSVPFSSVPFASRDPYPPQEEPLDLKVRKFPNEDTHFGNPQVHVADTTLLVHVADTTPSMQQKTRGTKTNTNVGLLECSSLPAGMGVPSRSMDTENSKRLPPKKRKLYTEEEAEPEPRRRKSASSNVTVPNPVPNPLALERIGTTLGSTGNTLSLTVTTQPESSLSVPITSIPNYSVPHSSVPNSPVPNSSRPNSSVPSSSVPSSSVSNTVSPSTPLFNAHSLPTTFNKMREFTPRTSGLSLKYPVVIDLELSDPEPSGNDPEYQSEAPKQMDQSKEQEGKIRQETAPQERRSLEKDIVAEKDTAAQEEMQEKSEEDSKETNRPTTQQQQFPQQEQMLRMVALEKSKEKGPTTTRIQTLSPINKTTNLQTRLTLFGPNSTQSGPRVATSTRYITTQKYSTTDSIPSGASNIDQLKPTHSLPANLSSLPIQRSGGVVPRHSGVTHRLTVASSNNKSTAASTQVGSAPTTVSSDRIPGNTVVVSSNAGTPLISVKSLPTNRISQASLRPANSIPTTVTTSSPSTPSILPSNQSRVPSNKAPVSTATSATTAAATAIPENLDNIFQQHQSMALQQDDDGDLPLHIAVVQNETELCDRLISFMIVSKVSLDHQNHLRQTPLHLAVIVQQDMLVKQLLQGGSNPNLTERKGMTAVQLAVNKRNNGMLDLIIRESKHKLDLNHKNYDGMTALIMAVVTGQADMVTKLLAEGANINIQDGKSGRTAIFHAAENNMYRIASLLLQKGAQVNIPSYSGSTPAQAANGRGRSEMVGLLIKYGADNSSTSSNATGYPEVASRRDRSRDRGGARQRGMTTLKYTENASVKDMLRENLKSRTYTEDEPMDQSSNGTS